MPAALRSSGLLILMVSTVLAVTGCADRVKAKREQFRTREQAFLLIDEASRLEVQGMPLLALERYNRAATLYDSPEAYYRMGQLFESEDKLERAAVAYSEALQLAPDYQEAKFAMLSIGYQPPGYEATQEDVALADQWIAEHRAEIQRLKSLDQPTTAPLQAGLTEEERMEQRRELIAEAAEQRRPTQAEVRAVLFQPRGAQQRLPSATDPIYSSTEDIVLGTYPYHMQKAGQLERRQQFEEAAVEYERALQADETQIEARLSIGDMMMRLEHHPRARFHYERALEDFPESPQPNLKLGNYFLALKQPDRALEQYRIAVDKDPFYAEAYNNIAFIQMQRGNYDEAAAIFDQIKEMDPLYANAYLNRGIIAGDIQNDRQTALENYRRYVELNGPRAAEVSRWVREMEREQTPAQ